MYITEVHHILSTLAPNMNNLIEDWLSIEAFNKPCCRVRWYDLKQEKGNEITEANGGIWPEVNL